MNLAQVLMRCRALQETIERRQLRPAKVGKTQPGDMPTERLLELPAALEVELQTQRALILQGNPAHSRATLSDGMTLMPVIAQCDYLERPRGILAASMTSAPSVQAHRLYVSKARLNSGVSPTVYRGRTAIPDLPGAERHHFEGGLRHVPALAGSAHSQAPPTPSEDEAGNRSHHT
jgi:hypothetical protein